MALATGPVLDDVCSFGHQLVSGSDPIKIIGTDATGKRTEETKLLRRHAVFGAASSVSVTNPTKLVAYPCGHGLPESSVPSSDVPYTPFKGASYGRAHWLTYSSVVIGKVFVLRAQCPVCLGEPAPDWLA